jgi:tRNA A-37 threonylcarbamoyl transferase component Bud32
MFGEYKVRVSGDNILDAGDLSITDSKKNKIVQLCGLNLRFIQGSKTELTLKTEEIASKAFVDFGNRTLEIERESLASAVWRSCCKGTFSSLAGRTLQMIGITKFTVKKFTPAPFTITQSCSFDPTPDKKIDAATLLPLFRENALKIECALAWSHRLVLKILEGSFSVEFLSDGDGQISFKIRPSQMRVPDQKPRPPPTKLVEAENVRFFGIDEGKENGFCSFEIEGERISLPSLSLWKYENIRFNIPEELLEGCIIFRFENDTLCLSVKSLLSSMSIATRSSQTKISLIEKGLRTLGITKRNVTSVSIDAYDEEPMVKLLIKNSVSEFDARKTFSFLQAHQFGLESRLAWVSKEVRMVKERKSKDLPCTIRCLLDSTGKGHFEITCGLIGSGADKVVKSEVVVSATNMDTLTRSRTRTKGENSSLRTHEEIVHSEERTAKEKKIIDSLNEKGVHFLLTSTEHSRLTRHGFTMQHISPKLERDLFDFRVALFRHILPGDQQAEKKSIFPGLCCLLSTIKVMHKRKIYHLDLKPANILLTITLSPRLIDFGMSIDLSDPASDTHLDGMGTLGYIAPEVFSSKKISSAKALDMFSFGVILYELMFITTPFFFEHQKFAEHHKEWSEEQLETWRSGLEAIVESTRRDLSTRQTSENDPLFKEALSLMYDLFAMDPALRPSASECLDRLVRSLGPLKITYEKMMADEERRHG